MDPGSGDGPCSVHQRTKTGRRRGSAGRPGGWAGRGAAIAAALSLLAALGSPSARAAAAPAAADVASDAAADAAPDDRIGPRYELYLDPFLGAESGSRDVATVVTAIASGEARLDTLLAEPNGAAPGSVALRSVRMVVWDLPVGWWFGVVLHEAFGHGGRAREFNASPGVHLGSPWEGRVSFASFDSRGKSTEELLEIYAGGTESNTVEAALLERRAVEGVRLRPLDLWFLASNRFVATRYVLHTTPDPRRRPAAFYEEYAGGGDVANYLGLLHELHGSGSGIAPGGVDAVILREYGRLRRQAWLNALDPGLWWALGSAFKMTARGDDAAPLPLPRIGRRRFLPILSTEWTPSGAQASLELAMAGAPSAHPSSNASAPASARIVPAAGAASPGWFSFIVRRGDGPAGPFGALGAAGDGLPRGRVTLGGAAEMWNDRRNGLGGGARLRLRAARGALRGFFIDVGVKSQGYWAGQPASPGPFGGIGMTYER